MSTKSSIGEFITFPTPNAPAHMVFSSHSHVTPTATPSNWFALIEAICKHNILSICFLRVYCYCWIICISNDYIMLYTSAFITGISITIYYKIKLYYTKLYTRVLKITVNANSITTQTKYLLWWNYNWNIQWSIIVWHTCLCEIFT